MISFVYQAYDSHGAKISGTVEAISETEAKKELKTQSLTVISLKEERTKQNSILGFEKQTLTSSELEYITSELAILLKNGVKIDRSLQILHRNQTKGFAAKLLRQLHADVKQGKMLSEALSNYPDIFDTLYINLVRLGEASGSLPSIFEKLSEDLKFKSALRSKVIQSLTYPLVILSVCVLCVLFIFNYIVPQMSSLFEGISELPLYTQILLDVSNWMQSYQWILFIAIAFIIFGLITASRKPALKQKLDELYLKTPLKKVVIIIERIRFNSALSMMLSSGIVIDKAVELSAETVKNKHLRVGLVAAGERIKKGQALTESFSRSPIYPEFFLSLLEVGEESGELIPVFEEITSRSRNEFEKWTTTMTSVLEPLLILSMGGIVGSVVVTMLMSILAVNELGF